MRNSNKQQKDPDGGIDWEDIHSRMELISQMIENNQLISEEEKRRILAERAGYYAREDEIINPGEHHMEVVEFLLAEERYGFNMNFVLEVFTFTELTRLPGLPSFIAGVINVRGKILTIMDVRNFFGLPDHGISELSKAIIVHAAGAEIGILADEITGIRRIDEGSIQKKLPTFTGIRAEYTKGISRDQTVLLDMEKILSDERIQINDTESSHRKI